MSEGALLRVVVECLQGNRVVEPYCPHHTRRQHELRFFERCLSLWSRMRTPPFSLGVTCPFSMAFRPTESECWRSFFPVKVRSYIKCLYNKSIQNSSFTFISLSFSSQRPLTDERPHFSTEQFRVLSGRQSPYNNILAAPVGGAGAGPLRHALTPGVLKLGDGRWRPALSF